MVNNCDTAQYFLYFLKKSVHENKLATNFRIMTLIWYQNQRQFEQEAWRGLGKHSNFRQNEGNQRGPRNNNILVVRLI